MKEEKPLPGNVNGPVIVCVMEVDEEHLDCFHIVLTSKNGIRAETNIYFYR